MAQQIVCHAIFIENIFNKKHVRLLRSHSFHHLPGKTGTGPQWFLRSGLPGPLITTCICAAGQNRLHSASSPGSELSRLRNDSINGVWKSGRFYPVHNYGANSKLALIWLVCSLCLDQAARRSSSSAVAATAESRDVLAAYCLAFSSSSISSWVFASPYP